MLASTRWGRRFRLPVSPGAIAVWRFSPWDALLVALAGLHGLVLALGPAAPVIAIGVWWNANTIAHNFIHRPFFRLAPANRVFSAALSLLLGIPQSLWRDRHLAHHTAVPWRLRISGQLVLETAMVLALWASLAIAAPRFFLLAYAPGYLVGLALCALQGHWEHAGGETISHYGWLYNFLCCNDGFHVEHHADPSRHWTRLASQRTAGAATSRWPALLRWLDVSPLEWLERLVLRSSGLQRFVLRAHRQAIGKLIPPAERVAIVGGGLYPRTALILQELAPSAQITIIDANAGNLLTARQWAGPNLEFRHQWYLPGECEEFDLLVIPLCFRGDRKAIYRQPPAPAVLVHDWIWRRRGRSAVVSWLLLKRLNLVTA